MATTIYSLPKFLPAPTVDYENYDHEKVEADEQEHKKALQQYLKQANFNGKLTGEIVRFQIADGYAEYMVADAGRVWGLIHLPYGDAYKFPYIHKLSKTEIKKQIETDKKMAQLLENAKKMAQLLETDKKMAQLLENAKKMAQLLEKCLTFKRNYDIIIL